MGGNRYSGPRYTRVYEGQIREIAKKSRGIGVFLILSRYQGHGTRETAGTSVDDRAVCVPVSSIAEQLGCSKAQVYSALDTLKKWTFIDRDGAEHSFIEVAPGCNGRKGHSAVYLINLPRESGGLAVGGCADAVPLHESGSNDSWSPDDSCARGDSLIDGNRSSSVTEEVVAEEDRGRETGREKYFADFNMLKPFMPSTDGFRFGFDNYMALRERGFTAEEIEAAAERMTATMREDYPDRPAKYFPHAERLLDPANPQGVCGYLDQRKLRASRGPTDRELFMFAMTSDAGDLTRTALSINDRIVKCTSPNGKEELRRGRKEWIDGNRDRLIALWRVRHT